jgi:hypothetical protein
LDRTYQAMKDRKIAILHIQKQYQSNFPPTQSPRNASQTSPCPSDSKTKTSSNGASASKDQKTPPSKADSTRPPSASHKSSPTSPPKCPSKQKCSTPTVPLPQISLSQRRCLHLYPASPRRRPPQPTGEIVIKMEPSPHHRGSTDERYLHAGRPQSGLPRQRRRRQTLEREPQVIRSQTTTPSPQKYRRRLIHAKLKLYNHHPLANMPQTSG